MMLVKDMYNQLATITGFPIYTNDTDTPDINRFILQSLNEGLRNVIDSLYMSNNVLERTDTIVTTPLKDKYGIEGIIKNLQLVEPTSTRQLEYNDKFNKSTEVPHYKTEDGKVKNTGKPCSYVIDGGYLRLIPMPDKEYTLKATLSTIDLVLADDDTSKLGIDSIDDAVLGNKDFCELVVMKAATIIFLRCQNNNASMYNELYQARLKTFIEHDSGTMEAQRGWIRPAGHYNPKKGLLGK